MVGARIPGSGRVTRCFADRINPLLARAGLVRNQVALQPDAPVARTATFTRVTRSSRSLRLRKVTRTGSGRAPGYRRSRTHTTELVRLPAQEAIRGSGGDGAAAAVPRPHASSPSRTCRHTRCVRLSGLAHPILA